VRERGVRTFVELAPELKTDPFWDAYRLLSRVDGFYRRMIRPLDLERAALVFEGEIATYSGRHALLVRELEKNPLFLHRGTPQRVDAAESSSFRTALSLVIDGRGGVRLRTLEARFEDDCEDRSFELMRDGATLIQGGANAVGEPERDLYLRPAVALFARPDGNDRRSDVETRLLPADYAFELVTRCEPKDIDVEGVHLATRSHVRSRPASAELLARVPQHWPAPSDVPKLEVGQSMAHPASLEGQGSESIEFGPGEVLIQETRVLPANTRVVIHAGTTLSLGPGASLVFRGPVEFQGSAALPITINGTGEGWGGIALQGPGTRGSRFRHVMVSGGSTVTLADHHYPAMVNLHDTADIRIDHCRFGENEGETDAVHVAYVDGLRVTATARCRRVPGRRRTRCCAVPCIAFSAARRPLWSASRSTISPARPSR
jgi:hypothetical protein